MTQSQQEKRLPAAVRQAVLVVKWSRAAEQRTVLALKRDLD